MSKVKSTGKPQSEINKETYKVNVTNKPKRWNLKQVDIFRKLGKDN